MTQGNIDIGTDKFVLGTGIGNVGTLTHTSGSVIGQFERWIASTGTPIKIPVGTPVYNNMFTIDYTDLTSGSLIVDSDMKAVALLFAGNDSDATYANPIQVVLDELGVDLVF